MAELEEEHPGEGALDETAGDILARKLSLLTVDEPNEFKFGAKVGIGSALAQMPLLEAIGTSGRTNFGTFGKKEAPVSAPSPTHFGAIDADAGLDRVAKVAEQLEKSRQKRFVTGADIAAERAQQQGIIDLIRRSDEENYGGLSDATMLTVRNKALESAAEKERFEMERRKRMSAESFGGLLDYVTKKGRQKMKDKKERVNRAIHEEKAKINDERVAERKAKKDAKKATSAPMGDKARPDSLPSLRKSGSFADSPMKPSERIAYEGANKKRELPPLVDMETFAKRSGRNEHAIASDEKLRQQRERKNNMNRFLVALRPPERALVEHMNELVRHSPGVGLQAVENSFRQLAPARPTDSNYLSALAFGSMLAKIRSDIEESAPIKGSELKRTTDFFHAQANIPMDASKARLFAEVIDQYGVHVRKAAAEVSASDRAQEEAAIHYGENVADALIASVPLASDSSWTANHPKIALAAVTDRLFQSVLKSAVNDEQFVSSRLNSFWAAEMPKGQWKAVAQKHFV